jgi:hypothetical protein
LLLTQLLERWKQPCTPEPQTSTGFHDHACYLGLGQTMRTVQGERLMGLQAIHQERLEAAPS